MEGSSKLMSDETQKRAYLEEITQNLGVSIEEINAVLYGEQSPVNPHTYQVILDAFISAPDCGFMGVIWEGEIGSGIHRNITQYEYVGQMMQALNLYVHNTDYVAQILGGAARLVDYAYVERVIQQHPNCGIVAISATIADVAYQVCSDYQRPIVFVDLPITLNDLDQYVITVDNKEAAKDVVYYLLGLGHRRIAYIHGSRLGQCTYERFEGYVAALSEHNIAVDNDLVMEGNWLEQGSYEATQQLLALANPPTAIFAASDRMAFGSIQALQDAGLSVPQDISVVGFDDIAKSSTVSPSLTTVHQPISRTGNMAAAYIIALLEGDQPAPRHVNLPTQFVIRDSTGKPPKAK